MAVQKNGGCTCNRVYLCLRMSQQTNDEWNARAHVCLCPGNHMTCRSCNHQVCAAARVPHPPLAADFGLSKYHHNCCWIECSSAGYAYETTPTTISNGEDVPEGSSPERNATSLGTRSTPSILDSAITGVQVAARIVWAHNIVPLFSTIAHTHIRWSVCLHDSQGSGISLI